MVGEADLVNRELNRPGLQEILGIVIEADIMKEGSTM